jgi:hypothetical protein
MKRTVFSVVIRVVRKRPDVSEEHIDSIIRVEEGGDVFYPKRRLTINGLHGVISQNIVLFITTAVRTSNHAN